MNRRSAPRPCKASSNIRVFSDVPLPSSTSVSAPDAAAIAARRGAQDRRLGAGRVILRQPGDLIEKIAAHLVVEPLGRQRFRRLTKTVLDVVAQRAVGGVACQVVGQTDAHQDPLNGVIVDDVAGRPRPDDGPARPASAGSSSKGSLASTTPSSRAAPTTCRPRWWPAGENHRRSGCSAGHSGRPPPTSATVSASASSPRSKINAASSALSTTDSATRDGGSTARSTTPLWDSSHRPSVNGARGRCLDRHASTGRAHRGDHAAAAQHRRHRRERRVAPQWRRTAPAADRVVGGRRRRRCRRIRRPTRRR